MAGSGGGLDVIATPIGNLGDLSPRALAALAAADLVAAEDTRHSAQLLAAAGLSRPMISLHEHNETQRIAALLTRMRNGERIALISDAGTPLLSDPGYLLVSAAASAGISVRAIPGPSAITAALSVAGLPTDNFVFEGFLSARAAQRRQQLQVLSIETRTLVLFEAPHRILDTLKDLLTVFGAERQAVVARELTKAHESIYRGSIGQLVAMAETDANLARGEIVLVIAGAAVSEQGDMALLGRALPLLLKELPPARAASIAAKLAEVPRETAYQMAMQLAGREPSKD